MPESFDQFLPLLVIALLALVERVVRALRERRARERAAATPAPAERAGPPPTPRPVPRRPGTVPPPLPSAAPPPVPAGRAARDHVRSRATPRLEAPAPKSAARRARRGSARTLLGGPLDMRRAMVIMAIVGPCRAVRPHAGPDDADRG